MEPCRSSGGVPGFGNLREVKPNRAGSNLPRNRCHCLAPLATTHGGGSGHSSSAATSVPPSRVPRDIFHLRLVRPRTPLLLQLTLPGTDAAATAASREQPPPAKPGGTARSSRPPAGISAAVPASARERDGSSFPFDHLPGIIPVWSGKGCSEPSTAPDSAGRTTRFPASLSDL
jgi:hypothetical protein